MRLNKICTLLSLSLEWLYLWMKNEVFTLCNITLIRRLILSLYAIILCIISCIGISSQAFKPWACLASSSKSSLGDSSSIIFFHMPFFFHSLITIVLWSHQIMLVWCVYIMPLMLVLGMYYRFMSWWLGFFFFFDEKEFHQ